MRKWLISGIVLIALIGGYVAWPFFGLAAIGSALHERDADEALQRIDVTAVRRSILNQVLDESTKHSRIDRQYGRIGRRLAVGFAVSALDRQFAALIDDRALVRLLRQGRLPESIEQPLRERRNDEAAASVFDFSSVPDNPLRYLRRWRFRSPTTFQVTVGATTRTADWTTLRLRRSGLQWRLTGVELPATIVERIAPVIRDRIAKIMV